MSAAAPQLVMNRGPVRSKNYLALGILIFAKVLGVAGLAVGASSRVLGGSMLALDGILIMVAVGICLKTMRSHAKEESEHKAVLRQMMNEGTLKQYLRDLEAERAAKSSAQDDDAAAE